MVTITCAFCGDEAQRGKSNARFCSDLCSQRARRRDGKKCSIEGCGRPAETRGWCGAHYRRWRTLGDVKAEIPVDGMVAGQPVRKGEPCDVPGCSRPVNTKGLCTTHYSRLLRGNLEPETPIRQFAPVGSGSVDQNGYRVVRSIGHPNAWKNGQILEHRLVMAEMLGRPLAADETVHHKNGDRLDNRRDNLELWVNKRPGQRVTDRVTDALELLQRYAPELLALDARPARQ